MYAKSGYAQSNFQRYRAIKIQTASPAQIMLMLYDGAIRFSQIAKKKVDEGDIAGKGTYISKVQAIVSELMSSLDFSIAPELCTQLQQLYIFMMEQLTEANIQVKTEPIDVVIDLLSTLRDGWSQALTSLPQDPTLNKRPGVVTGAPPPDAQMGGAGPMQQVPSDMAAVDAATAAVQQQAQQQGDGVSGSIPGQQATSQEPAAAQPAATPTPTTQLPQAARPGAIKPGQAPRLTPGKFAPRKFQPRPTQGGSFLNRRPGQGKPEDEG